MSHTVKTLIEELQKYPEDMEVWYVESKDAPDDTMTPITTIKQVSHDWKIDGYNQEMVGISSNGTNIGLYRAYEWSTGDRLSSL